MVHVLMEPGVHWRGGEESQVYEGNNSGSSASPPPEVLTDHLVVFLSFELPWCLQLQLSQHLL